MAAFLIASELSPGGMRMGGESCLERLRSLWSYDRITMGWEQASGVPEELPTTSSMLSPSVLGPQSGLSSSVITKVASPLRRTSWLAKPAWLPCQNYVRTLGLGGPVCMFFLPSRLSWKMGKERKEKNQIKYVSSKMSCVSSQAGFHLPSFLFSELSLTINPFPSPFVH